ncbi:MAG: hypothetical protein K2X48_18180 [Chitinophagaceae bacterium]|nr:hypothetical protein [Chitinophagaceae bacterium]
MKTVILTLFFAGIFGYTACYGQQTNDLWPTVSGVQLIQSNASLSLSWVADGESKELYYEIERSTDGINFKTIALVLGGFETNGNFSYQYREKLSSSKTFYRIKQIKQDGSSRIVSKKIL